jgi:hypothetical protein
MQSKGPSRDVAKERFWRRAVRQQRQSGQSIRAYCRAQGLTEASFYAWRRELARRAQQASAGFEGRQRPSPAVRGKGNRQALRGSNRAQRGGRRSQRSRRALGEGPRFLPVQVTSPGVLSLGGAWVECWLPGGVVLRLPAETAAGRLAEVVAACARGRDAWSEQDGRAAARTPR